MAPLLEIAGNAREELAADRRHDRDHHDREDEARPGSRPTLRRVAAENGMKPTVGKPRLDVLVQERPEDENPPQAEDDARDGREQLDHRAHRRPQHGGASSLRKSPIAIASGTGDEQRHEGADERPEDQVGRAERVLDGVPLARGRNPTPNSGSAGLAWSTTSKTRRAISADQPQSGERRRRPGGRRRRAATGGGASAQRTWALESQWYGACRGGSAGAVGGWRRRSAPSLKSRSWRSAPGRS